MTLGGVRRLLAFALFAACASQGHALFGDMFKNIFSNFGNMNKMIQETVESTFEKTTSQFSSIFAGVGGLPDDATRESTSFATIINGVFGRKNGLDVGRTAKDADWSVDTNQVIGVIMTKGGGGGASVSIDGGKVSFNTGGDTAESGDDDDEEEEESGDGDDKSSPTPTPTPTSTPSPTMTPTPSPASPSPSPSKDASPTPTSSPSPTPTKPTITGTENEAMDTLIQNWDDFMSAPIWDAQEDGSAGDDDDMLTGRARIVNGLFFGKALASGHEFSVKFFYNNETNFYCSGSLIGYPWVLTAAHCGIVVGDTVRVGGALIRSGFRATVDTVHIHPDFERNTLKNDVCLVKLSGLESKDVLNENGVVAAKINKNKKWPKAGDMLVLSGHGSVYENGTGFSEELLTTRQTVRNDSHCAEEITQGELKDDDDHLCAGDGYRSTSCVGDSGAGLWYYSVRRNRTTKAFQSGFFVVAGLVSFGEVTDESLCPRGPPTVYQETSVHHSWIREVAGDDLA